MTSFLYYQWKPALVTIRAASPSSESSSSSSPSPSSSPAVVTQGSSSSSSSSGSLFFPSENENNQNRLLYTLLAPALFGLAALCGMVFLHLHLRARREKKFLLCPCHSSSVCGESFFVLSYSSFSSTAGKESEKQEEVPSSSSSISQAGTETERLDEGQSAHTPPPPPLCSSFLSGPRPLPLHKAEKDGRRASRWKEKEKQARVGQAGCMDRIERRTM